MNSKKILFLAVFIYLFFAIGQINRSFIADEVDFVRASEILWKNGASSLGDCNISKVFEENETASGLWHPTLYLHSLAISYSMFHVNEFSARIVGVLCMLVSAALVYLISNRLLGLRKLSILAVVLYLVSPLLVQGSLVVDIDNTILTPLSLLFLYCVLLAEEGGWNTKSILLVSVVLALCLWAKLFTAIILILSVVIYLLLKEGVKAVKKVSVFCVLALVLYSVSWLLYSTLNNYSECQTLYPFLHLYKITKSQSGLSIMSMLKRAFTVVGWFFPQTLLVGVVVAYQRLREFKKDRKIGSIDLLIACGILLYTIYFISAPPWGFPRYQYPMVGMLCIIAAYSIRNLKMDGILKTLVVSAGILLVYYLVLGDPFLSFYTMKETLLEYPSKAVQVYANMLLKPVLFLLPSILLFIILRNRKIAVESSLMLSLLIPALAAGIAVDVIQARADYSTNYLYGETGLREALDYMSAMPEGASVLSQSKEIAFYLRNKDITMVFDRHMLQNKTVFLELLEKQNPDYIAVRTVRSEADYNTAGQPEVKQILEGKYDKKTFGSFAVYKKR
jgi:4-amino-4-deoxy-L-arabinose transferase-like glycosyltransferase